MPKWIDCIFIANIVVFVVLVVEIIKCRLMYNADYFDSQGYTQPSTNHRQMRFRVFFSAEGITDLCVVVAKDTYCDYVYTLESSEFVPVKCLIMLIFD